MKLFNLKIFRKMINAIEDEITGKFVILEDDEYNNIPYGEKREKKIYKIIALFARGDTLQEYFGRSRMRVFAQEVFPNKSDSQNPRTIGLANELYDDLSIALLELK